MEGKLKLNDRQIMTMFVFPVMAYVVVILFAILIQRLFGVNADLNLFFVLIFVVAAITNIFYFMVLGRMGYESVFQRLAVSVTASFAYLTYFILNYKIAYTNAVKTNDVIALATFIFVFVLIPMLFICFIAFKSFSLFVDKTGGG